MLQAFRKVNPVTEPLLHAVENNVDQALAPLLALPFADGRLITGVALTGVPLAINHLLGRALVGWFLVDNIANAVVWRVSASVATQITLNSSAATTVALWVF